MFACKTISPTSLLGSAFGDHFFPGFWMPHLEASFKISTRCSAKWCWYNGRAKWSLGSICASQACISPEIGPQVSLDHRFYSFFWGFRYGALTQPRAPAPKPTSCSLSFMDLVGPLTLQDGTFVYLGHVQAQTPANPGFQPCSLCGFSVFSAPQIFLYLKPIAPSLFSLFIFYPWLLYILRREVYDAWMHCTILIQKSDVLIF